MLIVTLVPYCIVNCSTTFCTTRDTLRPSFQTRAPDTNRATSPPKHTPSRSHVLQLAFSWDERPQRTTDCTRHIIKDSPLQRTPPTRWPRRAPAITQNTAWPPRCPSANSLETSWAAQTALDQVANLASTDQVNAAYQQNPVSPIESRPAYQQNGVSVHKAPSRNFDERRLGGRVWAMSQEGCRFLVSGGPKG